MSPGLDWLIFSTTYTQAHYWLSILCFWGLALCGFLKSAMGTQFLYRFPPKLPSGADTVGPRKMYNTHENKALAERVRKRGIWHPNCL
jgi:hypothetical protein